MQKKITFIFKATQDFICHTEADFKKNKPLLNGLFESISEIYIPLLNLAERLREGDFNPHFSVVLPPVLCNLLSDEVIQEKYLEFLEERNQLGLKELQRCSNPKVVKIVQNTIAKNNQLKSDFSEKYGKNLIKAYAQEVKNGTIELLATCGTDIFMPHYADMKEIISAQIESGLHSFRQFFGIVPEGFWIPELGYAPGVEKLIRAYGFTYTVLDARSILLGERYPSKGIFYPSRADNSLVLFAKEPDSDESIFGENGFINNENYRNEKSDIGFELSAEELSEVYDGNNLRFSTGFKYLNKNFNDSDNSYYDEEIAFAEAKKDALSFVKFDAEKLLNAAELTPDSDFVSLVHTFNAEKLFKEWHESIVWFEEVLKLLGESGLETANCSQLVANQYSLEKITPYYSSCEGTGYGENLLSSNNSWMIRYLRKASERMIDLAERFPSDTGLKTRLLNLGAKELMIAQSSNLAKMIENQDYSEFAIQRFTDSIKSFTAVFDSLGSNTVSTEWLTTLEAKDSIFPWMNYKIFAKKH